ncbi:DUF7097 family protein [Natrononativus amylolyticus]|uniref:DUF7097 family protein n=1 Tax=Natrononativus amylolyticus TaxID=2963434 RepID=UPI0020CBE696|nr:hypothetical protein [Natrononativus amylolyticus]
MEKTPRGTAVGVDDPYEFAGLCDHLTGEGTCRYAFDHYEHDPAFARERATEEYACPVVDSDTDEDWTWADCPHFRSRNRDRECVRCGLEEKRVAHSSERPLLEEHHLSYADGSSEEGTLSHEITVYLCRWCHAKVHTSWARLTDDVAPDPEAVAALEERRGREMDEFGFESAADRYERDRSDDRTT